MGVKRNTEIYIKRKNSKKSKKVLDKNMESLVHVLCALFGMASWLAINGVWVELPMLVNVMPGGWSLASQLSIIIQLANIGPLIVTLMDLYCRQRLNLKALIYSILLLGFASTLLLHFF